MTDDNLERELKLRPDEPGLLDRLAAVVRLGAFSVAGRRHEPQRNSFFDSSSRALNQARISFRRRTIEGESLATWSVKGEGKQSAGVSTRTEIELQLSPDTPPALALEALQQAARTRGAAALAEQLSDALAAGGLPLARPFLETETDRTILDLEVGDRGWRVELALDKVKLLGHAYTELEIEAELKRGDESALEAVRSAIASVGSTQQSEGSKLSRALAHVAACTDC